MEIRTSFKKLAGDIVSFVREDFHWGAYLYTACFVSLLVVAAYGFDGYQKYIAPLYWKNQSWWALPLIYSAVYFMAAIPNLLLRKEYDRLRNPRFYLKALFFICLMSFALGYRNYKGWFQGDGLTRLDSAFLTYSWVFADGIFLVVLPLAIYKYLFDRQIVGIYGLCRKTEHLQVYLLALLCLLPFVAAASYLPDFQSYYPRFRPDYYEGALGWPMWAVTAFFETCYGADFITTEVFFRGALVIGMSAILGPRAVLPMCVFYCSVHFGKPLLESCSAIFGGYILGILAYKTKHIWGGVCAHLGIAFMMEIMGLLHLFSHLG
ncbi:MAG: CPBP family intramembrane metalloprotease [Paludibacter sp.]|nr:CPBP family intramembrane metalloprotease [Bacteroidales bacterium]MCM1069390.1 CPBP family intramembrane metalloprotease [Prevotella sp.]MCM1353910.1 CPBP family intramembrane metalloprotease [Bacteroides sp.]MCM1442840.1 CPBP family intramembrane metalloprotease [Muribaculum sp.]MCM1481885.1 CPBP family intramembrane metalloprotease [Paludibacter sp.]